MKLESIEDYHSNPAISHSKLEVFRRRPALYYKRFVTREIEQETSAAFRLGCAVHCDVLEPLEKKSRFVQRPQGIDRRTKEGKELFAAFEKENAGKVILDEAEAAQVCRMGDEVRKHPLAAQLFAEGIPELSWRTTDEMPLQCRTDCFSSHGCELSGGRPYIADLKTVESLDSDGFRNFEKAVFSYGYHRQAGFYLPLVTELTDFPVFDFFFVAVEKVEPFGVAVYKLSDRAVAIGQDETVEDLINLKRCLKTNEWPNIPPDLIHLDLPKWYKGGAS